MFSICVIINKGYGVKMRLYFYYIIFINVFSFVLYGLDKFAAKINIRRIKEKLLHNISKIGGVYVSQIGIYLFHHLIYPIFRTYRDKTFHILSH